MRASVLGVVLVLIAGCASPRVAGRRETPSLAVPPGDPRVAIRQPDWIAGANRELEEADDSCRRCSLYSEACTYRRNAELWLAEHPTAFSTLHGREVDWCSDARTSCEVCRRAGTHLLTTGLPGALFELAFRMLISASSVGLCLR